MSTYASLADLPVVVEGHELEGLRLELPQWTRHTTLVRLRGAGEEGVGEDVTYGGDEQLAFQADGLALDLTGEHTLDSFSRLVASLDVFPAELEQHAWLDYRRWALESAALDLGLRQAGLPLWQVLGREPQPVTYVISTRASSLEPLIGLYPRIRFKLDATPDWTDEFVAGLAALDRVDVVDLKGAYRGTSVDNPADPGLYRRVAEGFPRAWIEDPALTPETDAVLSAHRDRVTWDAVVHSVADVDALPFPPRCLNVKPSRFGSVRAVLDFYDACDERGIALYGGGQFELGPGRGQIQYLASLFSPDGPNDVAPSAFNEPKPRADLPASPLHLSLADRGFQATT